MEIHIDGKWLTIGIRSTPHPISISVACVRVANTRECFHIPSVLYVNVHKYLFIHNMLTINWNLPSGKLFIHVTCILTHLYKYCMSLFYIHIDNIYPQSSCPYCIEFISGPELYQLPAYNIIPDICHSYYMCTAHIIYYNAKAVCVCVCIIIYIYAEI